MKRKCRRTISGVACCSSQEEQVLKPADAPAAKLTCHGCSSQEEQVLKQPVAKLRCRIAQLLLARGAGIETLRLFRTGNGTKLLLARGAGIETVSERSLYPRFCCSSQEEQVLKLISCILYQKRHRLLLARGAGIETLYP